MKTNTLIHSASWRCLEKGISRIEGKATRRTLAASDVRNGALRAESKLDAEHLPPALRIGITSEITVESAQGASRAPALSTYVNLIRKSRGWDVSEIGRKVIRPPASYPKLGFTPAATDFIRNARSVAPVAEDGQLSFPNFK